VRQIGRQALVAAADVAVEQEVQAMFERMIDTFGRIDILINNSGIQLNAPFDQMSLAQWQRVIDINLTGQFLCAREAVRAFKRQGIKLIGKPIIRGGQASRRMSQPSRRSRKLSRSSSAV
jgi:NAD(P)-dependent dehydrogenase (short-subunit alcohol dehydrogenase family)